MSNVPRRFSSFKGIKNKPTYKVFNCAVIILTLAVWIGLIVYFLCNCEYIGLGEFQHYINPRTGEEEGVVTTILSYILVFVMGLIAFAITWFLQMIAIMVIMGTEDKESDDAMFLFTLWDRCIVILACILMIVLDMFQIYEVF